MNKDFDMIPIGAIKADSEDIRCSLTFVKRKRVEVMLYVNPLY